MSRRLFIAHRTKRIDDNLITAASVGHIKL